MKLVLLIKICWNETYSKVQAGKHLCESFPTENGLKHASSPLLYNCRLNSAIRKAKTNHFKMKFNGAYELLCDHAY